MPRRLRLLTLLLALAAPAAAQEDFTTLKGHGGPVMGIAVAPSGQVASASFDNSVGLWTGRSPLWLEGHDAAVVDLTFVDDTTLASGGDDFTVRLWQSGAGTVLGRHKGKVTDLAVSPDGRTLASASWDGSVGLWPLADKTAPRMLDQQHGGVNDVAFSPDGTRLFAATAFGDLVAYDLTSNLPPRKLAAHGFGINEMIVAPDGRWIAYGTVDGTTRVIDAATGAPLRQFAVERKPVLAMAFHPGTNSIAVGYGDGYIITLDTAGPPEKWRIAKGFQAMREGPVWALAYAPDGGVIWAGGLDNVVYGWPVSLLGAFEPVAGASDKSFLRKAGTMPNGERQFMRKCSICHSLTDDSSRKAGPSLHGVFGRPAGTLPGYRYSPTLSGSDIVWNDATIDALFDIGPDHYIPDSKMPMQRITRAEDRADLIEFLKRETQ